MDIQAKLDEIVAGDPALQVYVVRLWYVPEGEPMPAVCQYGLRVQSMASGERHLLVGVEATQKLVVVLELLLALAATQPG